MQVSRKLCKLLGQKMDFSDDDFIGGGLSDTDFTVQMEGKDRKFKLKRSQMTCETLSKIFKLVPLSIILYGSDDTVVVPNSSGVFTGIRIHDTNTWTVSGDDLPPTVQAKTPSPFSFSSTAGSCSGFEELRLPATRQPGKRFRGQKKSRLAGTFTHLFYNIKAYPFLIINTEKITCIKGTSNCLDCYKIQVKQNKLLLNFCWFNWNH